MIILKTQSTKCENLKHSQRSWKLPASLRKYERTELKWHQLSVSSLLSPQPGINHNKIIRNMKIFLSFHKHEESRLPKTMPTSHLFLMETVSYCFLFRNASFIRGIEHKKNPWLHSFSYLYPPHHQNPPQLPILCPGLMVCWLIKGSAFMRFVSMY